MPELDINIIYNDHKGVWDCIIWNSSKGAKPIFTFSAVDFNAVVQAMYDFLMDQSKW